MCPFLNLKYIKIPMYGLMILLGVFIASFISYILCKKRKKSFDDFIIISVLTISFGFVFAKILFLLISYPLKDFFKIVFYILFKSKNNEINSGFVFYGGLIGGPLGFYLGLKITKAKIEDFIDFFAFLIPFVHSFGRLGCFFAGCCYGKLYDGIFSVIYKNPISDVPVGVGIFPVQLFESFFLLMISIFILILFLREKKNLFFIYLILYSVLRFVLEYFRFDSQRGFYLFFSTSQWISIFVFLLSLVFILINLKKCRKLE